MIKVAEEDLKRIKGCLDMVYKELQAINASLDDLNKYVPTEAFLEDEVYSTLQLVEELMEEDETGYYSEGIDFDEFDN